MKRARSLVLLLSIATLLMATTLSRGFAEAHQNLAGVTFEAIPTGDYKVDPGHSLIGFSVRHFEISFVRGRFKEFNGMIRYDAADVTKSTVEFTAKTESIDTGVAGRDNHLRTADFFDAAKFPELTFKSNCCRTKNQQRICTPRRLHPERSYQADLLSFHDDWRS